MSNRPARPPSRRSPRRPTQRCEQCRRFARSRVYGMCLSCYEQRVKDQGELAVLVSTYKMGPVKFVCTDIDTVYAHFYRSYRGVPISTERQWCMELKYEAGYPCPATVRFVSPYFYTDDNPLWWPPLRITADPVAQTLDLDCVSQRTAKRSLLPTDSKNAPQWSPAAYVALLGALIKESRF